MDNKNRHITLYTSQSNEIIKRLENNEPHFVKMKYIIKKYEEVADVFTIPYIWYTKEAEKIVPRPKEAESAVWAYGDISSLEVFLENQIVELLVPIEECVFFTMEDWKKVLNGLYIGIDEEDEKAFFMDCKEKGIGYMGEVVKSNFYPEEKKIILDSWQRIFALDKKVKENKLEKLPKDLQAGLWTINPAWMIRNLTTNKIYKDVIDCQPKIQK